MRRRLAVLATLICVAAAACGTTDVPRSLAQEFPDAAPTPTNQALDDYLVVAHEGTAAVVLYQLHRTSGPTYVTHVDVCRGARAVAGAQGGFYFTPAFVLCRGALWRVNFDNRTARLELTGLGVGDDVAALADMVAVADLDPGQVTLWNEISAHPIAIPGATEVTHVEMVRVRNRVVAIAATSTGELWWIDAASAGPPQQVASLGEPVGGMSISTLTPNQPSLLVTGQTSGSLYDIQLWPLYCPGSCFVPPPQQLVGTPAAVVQAQDISWNTGSVDVWIAFPAADEIRESPLGGGASMPAPGAAGMTVRHWPAAPGYSPNNSTVIVAAPDADEVRGRRVGDQTTTWAVSWGPYARPIDVSIAHGGIVVPTSGPPHMGVPVPGKPITQKIELANGLPEPLTIVKATLLDDDQALLLSGDECTGAQLAGNGEGTCSVEVTCTLADAHKTIAPLDLVVEHDEISEVATVWIECHLEE